MRLHIKHYQTTISFLIREGSSFVAIAIGIAIDIWIDREIPMAMAMTKLEPSLGIVIAIGISRTIPMAMATKLEPSLLQD